MKIAERAGKKIGLICLAAALAAALAGCGGKGPLDPGDRKSGV